MIKFCNVKKKHRTTNLLKVVLCVIALVIGVNGIAWAAAGVVNKSSGSQSNNIIMLPGGTVGVTQDGKENVIISPSGTGHLKDGTPVAIPHYISEAAKAQEEQNRRNQATTQSNLPPSQQQSYNAGRFIAYNNGTVLDTSTNLMWAARDSGAFINWVNAKYYCENYRGGGYTDWRMPTQDELAGLYDPGKTKPNKMDPNHPLHLTELINNSACCPWTSETRGSQAARFDFMFGGRGWPSQDSIAPALPVRSAR